jgi:hypothetical protein
MTTWGEEEDVAGQAGRRKEMRRRRREREFPLALSHKGGGDCL